MWVEITQQEYGSLFSQHPAVDWRVFASFSDPYGAKFGHGGDGKPEYLTEWGLEGDESPLLKYHEHSGQTHYFKSQTIEEADHD